MNTCATYADGRPYRAPRSRFTSDVCPLIAPPPVVAIALERSAVNWPRFWQLIQSQLRQGGFQTGTLKVYRQVLRAFRTFVEAQRGGAPHRSGGRPADATPKLARAFIAGYVDEQVSWSRLSTVIAVLRTSFDKLGGLRITEGMCTPRRTDPLGEVVTAAEAARMIECCPTIRDRLIIGLLFGCGLKVGELCALRWADIDPVARQLTVHFDGGARRRAVPVPEALLPVLAEGVKRCEPNSHIFVGGRTNPALSTRSVERIVNRAARDAGVLKEVCCMSLRNGYAVDRLRRGDSIRAVQEALGHKHVATTMRYQRWLLPDLVNPADIAEGLQVQTAVAPPVELPHVSAESLALPFPALANTAPAFQARLKTQFTACYLALRRFRSQLQAHPP